MNMCKCCEGKYFITANKEGQCVKGGAEANHIAAYDFEKSENVLECGI